MALGRPATQDQCARRDEHRGPAHVPVRTQSFDLGQQRGGERRQLRRHEYVVGKYLGILSVLVAFIAIDGAAVLGILAAESGARIASAAA